MNTSIFCDQPAKNAVIYSVFLLGFQKHWYLQCFVHLGSKKHWYLQHFLRFCMAPAKDQFRKAEKSSEQCVKTALFSDFRYPQNRGDYALGDAYERPGFRPKSSPPPS